MKNVYYSFPKKKLKFKTQLILDQTTINEVSIEGSKIVYGLNSILSVYLSEENLINFLSKFSMIDFKLQSTYDQEMCLFSLLI